MFSITYFICSAYSTVHQQLLTDDPAVYANMNVTRAPLLHVTPWGVKDVRKNLFDQKALGKHRQMGVMEITVTNYLFQNNIGFCFMLLFLCTLASDDHT